MRSQLWFLDGVKNFINVAVYNVFSETELGNSYVSIKEKKSKDSSLFMDLRDKRLLYHI